MQSLLRLVSNAFVQPSTVISSRCGYAEFLFPVPVEMYCIDDLSIGFVLVSLQIPLLTLWMWPGEFYNISTDLRLLISFPLLRPC